MTNKPYQISVDLDVFKALTALIQADGQDHNDVLREILKLDSPLEADLQSGIFETPNALARFAYPGQFYSRGLALPDSTELRARYKGVQHFASVRNGRWWNDDGREFSSPSAAASAITNTTVNGWRFWEARLPGDKGWRRLDIVRSLSARG